MKYYMGLDTATTTGIALWIPGEQRALVSEITGDPNEQFDYIVGDACPDDDENVAFVMEQMHYFRNAKTIRSLVERYGYLKYSLLGLGYPVYEVAPSVARHHLGVKSKKETHSLFLPHFDGEKFTSNHSDALAVALKQACDDGENFRLEALEII